MSALGHEQTSRHVRVMSVIPLKADIHQRGLHVRLCATSRHSHSQECHERRERMDAGDSRLFNMTRREVTFPISDLGWTPA